MLRVTVLPELLMDVLQASIEGSVGSRMLKPQIAAVELFPRIPGKQRNAPVKLSGSMLQRGCVAGDSGVPCDISVGSLHTTNYPATFVTFCPSSTLFIWQMLGDPSFSPYDKHTFQPRWEAPALALSWKLENGMNIV